MFADDLMLFCRADGQDLECWEGLELYKTWSGQCSNHDKSTIFSSNNVSSEKLEDLGGIVGTSPSADTIEYLRHQLFLKGRVLGSFGDLIEKVAAKLN